MGLAKALLHAPPILILDEPSSGLDPNQQREMRRFIRGLGERCAVIFSTHILPEVSAACDRVIVINEGKLGGGGSVDRVYEQASLSPQVACRVAGDPERAARACRAVPGVRHVTIEDDEVGGATGAPMGLVMDLEEAPGQDLLQRLASALHEAGVVAWGLDVRERSLEDAFARADPAATANSGPRWCCPGDGPHQRSRCGCGNR